MNIYTEKGLERWCLFCYGLFALFMVAMAFFAFEATFGG